MSVMLNVVALTASAIGATCWRRLTTGARHPAWAFRTELAVAVLQRLTGASRRRGVQWLRDAQAGAPSSLPASLRALRREAVVADGVPCEWTWPTGVSGDPRAAIVYIHGGGYVAGTLATHREIASRLVAGVGVPVLAVDYRLAPEHRYPAAHDDCLRAVRWLRARGVSAECTAIAGDSAGGALALATLLALRDAGEPQLAGAALLCPWVDPLARTGSMLDNARFDFLDHEILSAWVRAYATDEQIATPPLSLLTADLRSLPRLFIQVGELEVLCDQIRALAARARAAGMPVEIDEHPAMVHDFQVLSSLLPPGLVGVERVVAFLRAVVGRGGDHFVIAGLLG